MEKRIEKLNKKQERKQKYNEFCRKICKLFFDWYGKMGEKVVNAFRPKTFDKESFRKWFERPRNFKRFVYFHNDEWFSIHICLLHSSFENKLKKWSKFSNQVYDYLVKEYEISGWEKEVCDDCVMPCEYDVNFYKK